MTIIQEKLSTEAIPAPTWAVGQKFSCWCNAVFQIDEGDLVYPHDPLLFRDVYVIHCPCCSRPQPFCPDNDKDTIKWALEELGQQAEENRRKRLASLLVKGTPWTSEERIEAQEFLAKALMVLERRLHLC